MKILGLSKINSGCGYHRIMLPMGFMPDIKGHITNVATEEVMDEGWDILFYNRFCNLDDSWETIRKKYSFKVVYDLDDDWILPPGHLNYEQYLHLRPYVERNLRNADLVIVSNERIADRCRQFSDNVKVIPNGLPFGNDQFTDEKQADEKIRIFWSGSITHEKDINILRNPIKKLMSHKHDVKMIMGGYDDSNAPSKAIWDRMLSAFSNGKQLDYAVVKGMLPNKYMYQYQFGDIMLIPLEKSDWHAAKSNLKVLEAASKRMPVIVSNVEPYSRDKDAPVFFVNSQQDWYHNLNLLIKDRNAREQTGEALHQWAVSKFNLYKINEDRKAAFESICKA